MTMKLTFDKERALELYHDHKTDTEIAVAVGSKKGTITSWRNRSNLPNISTDYHHKAAYPDERAGVSFRSVLNEEQCEKMCQFLHALAWAADYAKKEGIKPDVWLFMRAFSGRTVRSPEVKREYREQMKHWNSRRRVK